MDPHHSAVHKQMGNSSPPVVTSRSCSLGGSSRLCRQLGRVVSLPIPSADASASLHIPISPRQTRSQHSPEPGLSWWEHHHHLFFHQLHGQEGSPSPLSKWIVLIWIYTKIPKLYILFCLVCHAWPLLHWHLRKCRLLICYWSLFTLIFSNFLGKETGMICF